MIPLKLTLENFKCYRKDVPTLHLEGVHIACLCGANGHGKSSLLDAMTWALWGDAVHKPQEELVHLGEQDMRVEMEFLAGGTEAQGGQRYRVIRRYARGRGPRAGATSLELHLATGDADPSTGSGQGFRSVSGNSVRETESAIEKLVGMDYTTFVNSAFLVQNRADEFTTKRPAERQRVLGKILGLDLYDRLQEQARQKARMLAADIQLLQGQFQAWSQEMARRPEYEAELPVVEAALYKARAELAKAEHEIATVKEQVDALRRRWQEMEELGRQQDVSRQELESLQAQASQHSQRIRSWDALTARETEIVQAYGRLVELRRRDEELNRLLEPHARLQERRGSLQSRQESGPALEQALAEAQGLLSQLDSSQAHWEARRTEFQEVQVQQQTLQAENQRLRQEMDGLRQKVDMLAQGDARCPLCGTALGEGGVEHIQAEYEAQGKALADQHRQNAAMLRDLESRHRAGTATLEREEKEMGENRRRLHGRIATTNHRLEEARKAPAELEVISQELARLGYDPAGHKEAKDAIQKLAASEDEHRSLQQAVEGLPKERENIGRVTALAQRRQEAIAQAEQRMSAAHLEVQALQSLDQQLAGVAASLSRLLSGQQEQVSRHGFLEARLKEYKDTESKIAEAEAALKAASQEREVFDQLAIAFGRTGVQALLVEAAIPELETEANRLLARMTDNTMHLKLETQRESGRGETVETLEIKVSDPLGTRSYETFSGGEAFRINLALRIGLSKLLAHRAGAPLPTLFIDEGFGTQDAAGRERILDVIQSIADDFQCILVITHMEEVKDAFPVRIEVQKTPTGSTFALT
ncbi:MAG: SMC family ATPase [Dehalococcoidia bacterium]|nr:SMC family ATPase [Dehalococcoidia bacterium]